MNQHIVYYYINTVLSQKVFMRTAVVVKREPLLR